MERSLYRRRFFESVSTIPPEAAVYGIPVFRPKYQNSNEAVSLIREGGAFSISNGAEPSEILDS